MNIPRLPLVVTFAVLGGSMLGCQKNQPVADEASPGEQQLVAQGVDKMKLVADGANKQLSYKATEYGRLYLYDLDAGRFIYKGYLASGEQFVFEPASSRAEISKHHVDLEYVTNEHDQYQLFFAPQ
jgi:hypothetical protein